MKQFLTAVIIVAIAGGAYWWWQNQNTATNGEMMDSGSETTGNDSMQDAIDDGAMMEDGVVGGSAASQSATISYNGTGFSPNQVTIKKGGTATWTNTGSGDMWVASAQHPTHTVYAGTSLQEHCPGGTADAFDQCKAGDSYSFTFDKVGTWYFHDHINASAFGSVVVVE